MRELIKEFVSLCVQTLPLEEPIYEFGSLQVPGQEGFADLRPLFPGRKYVGSDMREGLGVDVVLDLHNIAVADNSVGTALAMDTLEHVEFPHRALEELCRITHPHGIVVISSHMKKAIHAYPNDYWRFSPEGFRVLLRPFTDSFVAYAGQASFPHTVVGVGFKGYRPELERFTVAVSQWQRRWDAPIHESLLQKWVRKLGRSSRKRWDAILRRV